MSAPGAYFTTAVKAESGAGASVVIQYLSVKPIQPFSAAPYGILARHGRPDTQNFFVLHEGVVGMTDGQLLEKKYKAITELAATGAEGPAPVSYTHLTLPTILRV